MKRGMIGIVAVVGLASACGSSSSNGMSDGGGSGGGTTVSGTVIGPMATAGPVVMLWFVDSTPSDYAYKFGDGTATATTFRVPELHDPPMAARSQAASVDIGIGIMTLLHPGAQLPDGALISQPNAIGYSLQYAAIYRGSADAGTVVAWTAAFPVGMSCGKCVVSTTGLDTFKPVDCTTLVIDTNLNAPSCNFN